MAPNRERSAAAQSLTLRQPIYCDEFAEGEYAIDGTPADAMILAFHMLLDDKPDLVVFRDQSRREHGRKRLYSTTVGAAMEAAINMACRRLPFRWRAARRISITRLRRVSRAPSRR